MHLNRNASGFMSVKQCHYLSLSRMPVILRNQSATALTQQMTINLPSPSQQTPRTNYRVGRLSTLYRSTYCLQPKCSARAFLIRTDKGRLYCSTDINPDAFLFFD